MAISGRSGNWLKAGVDGDGNQIAGHEPEQAEIEVGDGATRLALGEFVGGGGEDRAGRAVHHGRAEAAHHPDVGRHSGKRIR